MRKDRNHEHQANLLPRVEKGLSSCLHPANLHKAHDERAHQQVQSTCRRNHITVTRSSANYHLEERSHHHIELPIPKNYGNLRQGMTISTTTLTSGTNSRHIRISCRVKAKVSKTTDPGSSSRTTPMHSPQCHGNHHQEVHRLNHHQRATLLHHRKPSPKMRSRKTLDIRARPFNHDQTQPLHERTH